MERFEQLAAHCVKQMSHTYVLNKCTFLLRGPGATLKVTPVVVAKILNATPRIEVEVWTQQGWHSAVTGISLELAPEEVYSQLVDISFMFGAPSK